MPQNTAGKPIDPTEWNRNVGFCPGSILLTYAPGLDLTATWGTGVPQQTDLARSLGLDSPIVIAEARTGARHPFSPRSRACWPALSTRRR